MQIEEEAFTSMKLICCTKLSNDKEYELRNTVVKYFNDGEKDLLFKDRIRRFHTDKQSLRVLEVENQVKKDFNNIPDIIFAWFVVWKFYEQDEVVLSFPDAQIAKDQKLIDAVLLTYCYHLIKILWRKLDPMFPDNHNREEITMTIDLPDDSETMFVSKFIINQRKSDLDKDHQSNVKILTEPADKYHEKVFRALRRLPKFINNLYLDALWDIHPNNGDKVVKKTWRRFKNSAQTTLFIKNVFHLEEVKVTDDFKDLTLATSKPDSFTYSEQDRCGCDHH